MNQEKIINKDYKQSVTSSNWYLVDAKNHVLGKLSSFLAIRLMGKHKTSYSDNICIICFNAFCLFLFLFWYFIFALTVSVNLQLVDLCMLYATLLALAFFQWLRHPVSVQIKITNISYVVCFG